MRIATGRAPRARRRGTSQPAWERVAAGAGIVVLVLGLLAGIVERLRGGRATHPLSNRGPPQRRQRSRGRASPADGSGPTRTARAARLRERLVVAHRSAAALRRLSARGLAARRVRLALTALAIVFGVCFVSGTYVLTDTLKQSFDHVFAQTASGVDVVVRTRGAFGTDTGSRDRLPAAVLEQVRETAGVGRAEGVVEGYAQFVRRDGHGAIEEGGAPTIGVSWATRDHVGPLRVARGRAPRGAGEVAMDAATAAHYGFHVGDAVKVLLTGPAQQMRLVGTFCFASQCDLGGATFAAFDPVTAQQVFESPEAYDLIDVKAGPGVKPATLLTTLRDEAPGYDVSPAAQVATETGRRVHAAFGFLNGALLGFASIGLFVGAFIIFNTFTILVSQRTREFGLLRALGAHRGQVMRSVVAEAAVVGAAGSVLGLVLGIAFAIGLLDLVDRFGLHVPQSQIVVLGRTVAAAVGVGLVVTIASAIYPAFRASRVPPVAAINDFGPRASAPLGRRSAVGTLLLLVGVAVLGFGLMRHDPHLTSRMQVVGASALIVFVGVAMLGPGFTRPLSRVLGWPLRSALGVTGTLARGNAMRDPRRTAATASALTIGLSLVCLVAIFTASAKSSLHDALDTGLKADYILTAEQYAGFSALAAQRVAQLPSVRHVVPLRFDDALVAGNDEQISGVAVGGLSSVVNLGLTSGTSVLGADDILVSEVKAKSDHLETGSTLRVDLPGGGAQPFRVAGVYRNDHFAGTFPVSFLIDLTTFESNFGAQQDTLVYVRAAPGLDRAARRDIGRALADFPNVNVVTPAGFERQQEQTIDMVLAALVALLLLSEIIAILGIVNTLALSVYERTHELGLLRAVGTTPRQVRRIVRGESVIIAVIGGVLGLGIGVFWGWTMTHALRDQGITRFTVPPVQLAVFLAASALAGVVAAVYPAWRAGRLDVLDAIGILE